MKTNRLRTLFVAVFVLCVLTIPALGAEMEKGKMMGDTMPEGMMSMPMGMMGGMMSMMCIPMTGMEGMMSDEMKADMTMKQGEMMTKMGEMMMKQGQMMMEKGKKGMMKK